MSSREDVVATARSQSPPRTEGRTVTTIIAATATETEEEKNDATHTPQHLLPPTSLELPLTASDADVWAWAVTGASENDSPPDLSSSSAAKHPSAASSSSSSYCKQQPSLGKPHVPSSLSSSLLSEETASVATTATDGLSSSLENLPQVVFHHRTNSTTNNDHDPISHKTATDGGSNSDGSSSACLSCLRCRKGHSLLHVLPARLDPARADATLYATAIARYLDQQLILLRRGQKKQESSQTAVNNNDGDERFTLLLDVRPGRGWRNLPALELLGFTRHVVSTLQSRFPDRLHRCIVFPVPRPAVWLWKLFQGILLASGSGGSGHRVTVVPGGACLHSPVPRAALRAWVDDACLDVCEDARRACFAE